MSRMDVLSLAAGLLVIAACRTADAPLAPASADVSGGGLPGFPGTVTDLAVDEVTPTSATLSFTEVDDGLGQPASYVMRYATPPIEWASAHDVIEGTCAAPVRGKEIGARLTCTVANLAPSTTYEFEVTAYRATLELFVVSGEPSNVAQGTTTVGCDCWTPTSPMPTARVGLGVATINGVLYAVGGSGNDGAIYATIEAYDPTTDTWTTRAAMPTARTNAGLAAVNGILYVVGGSDGGTLATLEAYDPVTDTWTTKAPMPTARHSPGVAVVNGILYVVGGATGAEPTHGTLATVEAYDPATDTWTPRLSMPTSRSRLGVAVIDGILYAVGGLNSPLGAVATVEAYDPISGMWSKKKPMSFARYGLGVVAMQGSLYALGGFMNGPRATNERYDPASDTWTLKAQMPTARTALGVGTIGGMLYALGGSAEVSGPLATMDGYRP